MLYVSASKISDLKSLYPNLSKEIDQLYSADPTPTKKYIHWSIKQLKLGFDVQQIIDIIQNFHKYSLKLQNKDINSYSYNSLKNIISGLQDKPPLSIKEIKQSGSYKVYESPNFIVIHPKTKAATHFYASGTRWCITMKDETHFETYVLKGIPIFIIINKSASKSDPMHKIGIALIDEENNTYDAYDALNHLIGIDEVKNNVGPEFNLIQQAIENFNKTSGLNSNAEAINELKHSEDPEIRFKALLASPGKKSEKELNEIYELGINVGYIDILILNANKFPNKQNEIFELAAEGGWTTHLIENANKFPNKQNEIFELAVKKMLFSYLIDNADRFNEPIHSKILDLKKSATAIEFKLIKLANKLNDIGFYQTATKVKRFLH